MENISLYVFTITRPKLPIAQMFALKVDERYTFLNGHYNMTDLIKIIKIYCSEVVHSLLSSDRDTINYIFKGICAWQKQ